MLFFVLLVFLFAISANIISLLYILSKNRRKVLAKNVSFFSKVLIKILGLQIKLDSRSNLNGNHLIVSNHLSYLDILVISSLKPTCFVTSVEMSQMPFVGYLCKLAGCILVERRNRKNILNEVGDISTTLDEGVTVALFPEATSTNGDKVLPFKRTLFHSAIKSDVKILPICLNYKKINNHKINIYNRDRVFWYGEMTFFDHFLKLLKLKNIVIELIMFKEINSHEIGSKEELASRTHQLISEHFTPVSL